MIRLAAESRLHGYFLLGFTLGQQTRVALAADTAACFQVRGTIASPSCPGAGIAGRTRTAPILTRIRELRLGIAHQLLCTIEVFLCLRRLAAGGSAFVSGRGQGQ